ncbi:gamma tubulin complex Spc97/GCP2 subunit Alp4 [Marasmius sp. AFHP31]|nr:gamma tubulin complex Spc97/GCP2 subunit Alp4 [Marasmius sp. AFHP31]
MPKLKGKARQETLDHVPLELQEAMILEDLLYVLMVSHYFARSSGNDYNTQKGIEGNHITFHPNYSSEDDPLRGVRFTVSQSLDSSLRDLVERVLPLGTYYTAITAFIEQRSHLDFGLVNHALCASIRDMLKDYQTLLSQLEHAYNTSSQFSLQKLWFYVHPTVHTLSLIYNLVLELGLADSLPEEDSNSDSESSFDAEEEARNEELGIGKSKLKAVLADKNGRLTGDSGIKVKGGEVLAIIYERKLNMSGDPTANMLYGKLLRDAGTPYVNILKGWVTTGRLVDPYEELLVKESKFINRGILEIDYTDEYWERRYTLRDGSTLSDSKRHKAGVPPRRAVGGRLPGGACIPPLLESWKHKILLAGKYLNVIRECGIEIHREQTHTSDEKFSMDDERSATAAYTHANQTLLQLLLRDQQLIPRLRSLKRFFFLSQSFFLTHLLDLSHSELRKSAKSVSIVKLQSLLELTLNTDSHGDDTMFREDVKVIMAGSGLYEWLLKIINVKGMENADEANPVPQEDAKRDKGKDDKKPMLAIDALTLDYNVKFPLSLVISRKTILRYQFLFRFLLHLKHVEQSLATMWIEQKTGAWRQLVPDHADFNKWRLRVFLLRAKMLSFVQQILSFATSEVLEPNWRTLEAKLDKVTTVDQLLRDHVDFLDTCLKECMLTSKKLLEACVILPVIIEITEIGVLQAYSKLIVTCSTFALYTSSFNKSANSALVIAGSTDPDPDMQKRWDFLSKFETNFDHW